MAEPTGAHRHPATVPVHPPAGDDHRAPRGDRPRRWLVRALGDGAGGKRQDLGGMSTRRWRRLERQALASHDADTLSATRRLTGALEVRVQRSATEVLWLRGEAGQLGLAGAMVPAWLQGSRCRLDAAGRYGPLWWVRLVVGARTVTMLGSHLRVAPV